MPSPIPSRLVLAAAGLVLASAVGASGDDPSPSAVERDPNGWTDMLARAGPGLKGWTRVPIPPTATLIPDSQWSLDPTTGLLACRGDKVPEGHEWLRWDEPLGDFIYHVEWRFVPVDGGKRYNSGLYARNSADGTIWHQAQTGDARGGYLFGDTLVDGDLKRVNLSKEVLGERVRPAGEWNVYEINCQGRDVRLWVNGAITCEWHACEVPSGYVGLEAEGWKIEFRNLKVKPISRAD